MCVHLDFVTSLSSSSDQPGEDPPDLPCLSSNQQVAFMPMAAVWVDLARPQVHSEIRLVLEHALC